MSVYGAMLSILLWVVALVLIFMGARNLWGDDAAMLAVGIGLIYRAATIDVIAGLIMAKQMGAERVKKVLHQRYDG